MSIIHSYLKNEIKRFIIGSRACGDFLSGWLDLQYINFQPVRPKFNFHKICARSFISLKKVRTSYNVPRNVTIHNGINGTSKLPRACEANSTLLVLDISPFVSSPYRRLFPVGLLSIRPSPLSSLASPCREYHFLREQFRAVPREPIVEVRGSSADGIAQLAILGNPRRRVHPGHFADERAMGDPRDTVLRVFPKSVDESIEICTIKLACIRLKFATTHEEVHLTTLEYGAAKTT